MISVCIFINNKMIHRIDAVNRTRNMEKVIHDYEVENREDGHPEFTGESWLKHKRSLGAIPLAIKMLKWAKGR